MLPAGQVALRRPFRAGNGLPTVSAIDPAWMVATRSMLPTLFCMMCGCAGSCRLVRVLRAVHLLRGHLRRPRQSRVLPAVLQAEAGLRSFLDRRTLEAVDQVAGIRETVGAQKIGAGFAALAAGAAHGNDFGVRIEAAPVQLGTDFGNEV